MTSLVDLNFQVLPIGSNLDGSPYYVFDYGEGLISQGGGGQEEQAEETEEKEETPLTDEEKEEKNFTIEGTWSYEEGWGYTLSFDDGRDTTITADFDKASSCQYFYYDVAPAIDGQQQEAVQVQFQAEDREFRKEMAEDYVISEERNAKYMFEASGNTATGNAMKITILIKMIM